MRRMLIMFIAAFTGLVGGTVAAGAGNFSSASQGLAEPAITDATAHIPAAAPDMVLSTATSLVTDTLRQDSAFRTGSPAKVAELVASTIVPLFDFRHMTRLVMARNWRLSSPAQQDALVAEFTTLLVNTYSTALMSYRDQVIVYKPLTIAPGETDITVRSTMRRPGAERLTLDYDMAKTAAGWRVYDVRVGGVSLVTPYRSPFSQIVRDGGIDGLIKSLAARNRQTELASASGKNRSGPFLFIYTLMTHVFHGRQ